MLDATVARAAIREVRDQIFAAATARKRTAVQRGVILSLDGVSPRMRYVMVRGGYEDADASIASRFLTSSDRVLEAGSAVGFMAIHAIKNIGVRDYCMVEPNPEVWPMIARNFALNGVRMPSLLRAAISDRDGEIDFGISRNFWSSSTIERPEQKRVTVPCRSIPSILGELPFKPTALVMDIEGGEADVPVEHFSPFEKVIIELHPKLAGPARIESLLRQLKERGFRIAARSGGTCALLDQRQLA